jgi:uncharacterized protein
MTVPTPPLGPPPDRPVVVAPSPLAGRGLFTTRFVRHGEVLDVAPVVLVPASERHHLDATALSGHYWDWDGDAALAMGPISFTNHGRPGCARWERDDDACTMVLIATRDLGPGEEVLVDYLADGDPADELWFIPTQGPG